MCIFYLHRLRESEQALNSAMFPRLKSQFRYSGRTLYQARRTSQILERPDPYFERSQPARSIHATANARTKSVDDGDAELFFLGTMDLHISCL